MSSELQSESIRQRALFVFFPDPWRAAWFAGAVVLAAIVNTVFIEAVRLHEGIGFLSVLPLFAYLVDMGFRFARRARAGSGRPQ